MRQLRDIKFMMLALFGFGLLLPGSSALAEDLVFGPDLRRAGWTSVSFPGISAASFRVIGEAGVEVTADAAAGLLWRTLGECFASGQDCPLALACGRGRAADRSDKARCG